MSAKINEGLFFSNKESHQDKIDRKLGSYKPVPADSYSSEPAKGFDPDLADQDESEARKRVIGALGMAMGAGSVKSMANRALKTFPIIVSDDVSPDTCVMIKKALEEQYADYINLIVSNQVVDISKLEPASSKGNMAIQALDRLTGPEFGTKRIAAKAAEGDLSADDVMGNSAAYALLRRESHIPTTGDAYADSLLEGAIVVKDLNERSLAEKIIFSEALDAKKSISQIDAIDGVVSASEKALTNIKTRLQRELSAFAAGHGTASGISSALAASHRIADSVKAGIDGLIGHGSPIESLDAIAAASPEARDFKLSVDAIGSAVSDAGSKADDLINAIAAAESNATRQSAAGGLNLPAPNGTRSAGVNVSMDDIFDAIDAAYDAVQKIGDALVAARAEAMNAPEDVAADPLDEKQKKAKDLVDNLESMTNLKFDPDKLQVSMDDDKTSIGAIVANNPFLKDRFNKASYLLVSNRISGNEFISYCVVRLGIPLSRSTRAQLVTQFKASDVITGSYDVHTTKSGKTSLFGLISKEGAENISRNRLIYQRAMEDTFSLTPKQVWEIMGISVGGAAASGLAGWGIGAAITQSSAGNWLPWAIAVPAIIGGAASGAITYGVMKSRWGDSPDHFKAADGKYYKADNSKFGSETEGWERVEFLINQMDKNRKELWDLDREYVSSTGYYMDPASGKINYSGATENGKAIEADPRIKSMDISKDAKEFADIQKDYFKSVDAVYRVRPMMSGRNDGIKTGEYSVHEAYMPHAAAESKALCESIAASLSKCKDYIVESAMLKERVMNTPIKHTTYTYNVNPTDKDVSLVPEFGSKGLLAYGSVEYDKKELRDRRYNDPLVMTVKFNSRYNDGRTSDSSLTAVIGILGVITRVPSSEMEYVLKSNSEKNKAVKGVFKTDGAQPGNPIVDAISGAFKQADDDRDNLPNSGDLWNNLEKLSNLSVANKLAGKQMDNAVNAHIVFSMKEVSSCKQDTGDDYSKNVKLAIKLMRRYSALSVMIASDDLYGDGTLMICDDPDAIGWDVVPYSAFENRSIDDRTTKQLSAMAKLTRG